MISSISNFFSSKNSSNDSATSQPLFKFDVDKVKKETKAPALTTAQKILTDFMNIKEKSEDFSHRQETEATFVKGTLPGLVLALHTAYEHHYGLKLSVSDFILLIGQGIGKHMEVHSEKLRKHFVNHEEKEEIAIRRDHYVMGQQNDWSTVFGEFADNIKQRVKTDIYDIVVDDTSVATPTSRIVSELTLMDCMKGYFDYVVVTRCGIPEITLVGAPEDWENLRNKVQKLNDMNKEDCLGLAFWLKQLTPIIEKICDTAISKKVDKEFWSGIYKYSNPGSGTPFISGWITKFFPYLPSGVNEFKEPAQIKTSNLPKQISSIDFIWDYYHTLYGMKFHGGFLGAMYDSKTNTVEPAYFWTVVYDKERKNVERKYKKEGSD